MYKACMDEERIEKIGLDPLKVFISLQSFSFSAQYIFQLHLFSILFTNVVMNYEYLIYLGLFRSFVRS